MKKKNKCVNHQRRQRHQQHCWHPHHDGGNDVQIHLLLSQIPKNNYCDFFLAAFKKRRGEKKISHRGNVKVFFSCNIFLGRGGVAACTVHVVHLDWTWAACCLLVWGTGGRVKTETTGASAGWLKAFRGGTWKATECTAVGCKTWTQ